MVNCLHCKWLALHGTSNPYTSHVRYCCKDHPGKVFEVTAITDKDATFVHHPVGLPIVTLQVPLNEFSKWKVTKMLMPVTCPAIMAAKLHPQQVASVTDDFAKIKASMALHELFGQHAANQVTFALHPQGLYTNQAIKKSKGLKLVPLGTLTKAKAINKNAHYIEQGGHKWVINPFHAPQDFDDPKEDSTLVPFWWCKTTTDEDEVTMELTHMTLQGYKIPVLTNLFALDANTKLLYLKPALSNSNGKEPEEAMASKASKKAKKN